MHASLAEIPLTQPGIPSMHTAASWWRFHGPCYLHHDFVGPAQKCGLRLDQDLPGAPHTKCLHRTSPLHRGPGRAACTGLGRTGARRLQQKPTGEQNCWVVHPGGGGGGGGM
jgi:hypothetical protein